MKKLFKVAIVCLWSVMAFASCDKYTEEEFCPICMDMVSADRNSIIMTVIVNESYLQLNYCEFGAVCTTSTTPPSGNAGIPAIKTPLGRKGVYQLEFSGSFPESRYYVHLYTASHESGIARYHDCVEVVMGGAPVVPDGDGFINLSANGTANCYIVNGSGKYKFRPVKGNSDETLDVKSVEVLWESFGTDETPEVGALIPYAEYRDFDADGYFDVYFNATDRKGNAVIAAKDASGSILWSWHIWLTDQPVECVYANDAGTMMDRNLGATSATPGDVGALGLLYQWGRKDPFLGSSSISSGVEAKSTISWPEAVGSNASNGTISYATEHPTSFITRNSSNRDWYYTGGSNTDNTRWQSKKTIYDPCPAGWRVPDGGSDGVWAKAGFPSGTVIYSFNSSDSGMTFGAGICSPATWYPAAGYRCEDNGGDIRYTGSHGNYWSVSPYGGDMVGISALYFDQGGTVFTSHYSPSASGLPVRCMRDGQSSSTPTPTPTEDDWYLSGEFNDWITRDKNYKMTYEDGWFGFEGLVVPELCNLKLVLGEWKQSLGYETSMNVDGDPFKTGGMYDIRLPERGVYDVYLSADASQGRVVKTSGNAPVEDWYLVGDLNAWVTADQDYKMELDGFWYVYKGLEVTSEGDIKFVGEELNSWLGYESEMSVDGTPFETCAPGNNIRLPEAGTYNVYLSYDTFKARVVQGQAWGLSGSHNDWSTDVDTPMLKEGDRYVARGVEFNRSDNQFKVRLNNSWSNAWGLQDESIVLTDGSVVKLSTDSNNIRIEDGTYDLWLDPKQMTLSVSLIATALDPLNCVSLDSNGSSNCYIVSESGAYKFRSVQGNSETSVEDVSKGEVLWESFGTDVAPNVGDLIKSVSYKNGEITFQTADTFKEGNAVIAAKDASGTILWSWHIWLTDQPEEQVYYNNAGTMMDRNLGATSATPGDVGALGLLYQWGRKDPFLGSSSISESVEAESTISWPSAVQSDASNGTISYATEHPTTFICGNSYNGDWYYTGSYTTDNTCWQSLKTIYDPCPAGWRVPDGGENGVWAKALGSSSWYAGTYDESNEGMDFSNKFASGQIVWYPASGYCNPDSGVLEYVGRYGYYWSCTPNNSGAYEFSFAGINVAPVVSGDHALGIAVRCIKE